MVRKWHPRPITHRLCAAWWLAALGCQAVPALAQSSNPESLKAEVVYRLLMFVNWPPEREANERQIQFCIAGDGHFEYALQTLAGRNIRQFTISVRRLIRPDGSAGCHVLYLPAPKSALSLLPTDGSTLVISDAAGMLEHGAMINLQVEDGRIVFDVDLDAARRANLTISTKLLRLARFVRHQQGGGP